MKYLNWNPEKDNLLKTKEVTIHNRLHGTKLKSKNFESNISRIKLIKKMESITNKTIKGNVLDIGAGNGYASVFIASKRNANVWALECNENAMFLIDSHMKSAKVNTSKYKLALGSFNNIPLKNHFDFVISMGTLHHSGNLLHTMKEVFSSLKPGGWLFAQEPFSYDDTPNSFFYEKDKSNKDFCGISLKEGERDDHFFRKCEWLTAAYHSGFDVKMQHIGSNPNKTVHKSIMMLKKPNPPHPYIPHAWFK